MKKFSNKFAELGNIEPDSVLAYVSENSFSMHELLAHLLETTGPANVRIMSFSITEVAIRTFLNLIDSGKIQKLQCILDLSVKRYRLALLNFMNNVVTEISLIKNHAKLILIENEQWKVAVVSSANFNVNDKIEAGVILTKPLLFSVYDKHFVRWFNQGLKIQKDEFY